MCGVTTIKDGAKTSQPIDYILSIKNMSRIWQGSGATCFEIVTECLVMTLLLLTY